MNSKIKVCKDKNNKCNICNNTAKYYTIKNNKIIYLCNKCVIDNI